MRCRVFLIVNREGGHRVTKRPPWIDRGEICLRLNVNIPDGCFAAPAIDVAVEVPADQVQPASASVDVEAAESG